MGPATPVSVPFEEIVREERKTLDRIRKARAAGGKNSGKRRRVSLALSGGGIRSATFNLGLLQALAETGELADVEYISSVSGGGYINSWLSVWCARSGFSEALRSLKNVGGSGEAPSISHLRKFSNYLTPRLGLLSADTWSLESTYTRNLILNLLIVVLSLAGALLAPRLALSLFDLAGSLPGAVLLLAAFLLSTVAVSVVAFNFDYLSDIRDALRRRILEDQSGIQFFVVIPVFLVSILMSVWITVSTGEAVVSVIAALLWGAGVYTGLWMFAGGVVVLLLKPSVRTTNVSKMRDDRVGSLQSIGGATLVLVVTGALGGILFYYVSFWLRTLAAGGDLALFYLLSPVTLLVAFGLIVVLHIGLAGSGMTDEMREWWSRLGAWVSIYSFGWLALWFAVFRLPEFFGAMLGNAMLSAGTLLAWGGSTVTGVLLGKGAGTGGKVPDSSKEIAVKLAPLVFAAGFIALVSYGVDLFAGAPPWGNGLYYGPACALLCAVSYGLATRVDVNEFSMHAMYRNRLVRCYLGASRKRREPQPFTGLDPADDMLLGDIFRAHERGDYDGPFPIFNTTLNVSSAERLDWQQRKARSFPFTPLGFGFGDSNILLGAGRADTPVSVGNVMATSGAAVSPNMGFHTSTTVSFLLTIFNVRLGQWFFNPSRMKKGDRLPRLSLFYLFYELFGLTKDTSRYVYLSDGGHFENLGLYELVRRECNYIIVSDASGDGCYGFEDLGNAIEKCRVDFGVEITGLRTGGIVPDGGTGLSSAHATSGKIRYRGKTGVIVYLKPSLTGDEPQDVMSYRAAQMAFPHQSTGDQWFDESQFEAYRALGYHIGMTVPR
jgi:hypothetical protein